MVTTHDFIFSNRLRHRISRHTIFWLAFWLYQLLTLFYPGFWFPGWRLQGNMGPVERIGIFRFIAFSLAETLVGGVSTYAFFVYPILYFILPRFLYRGRWLATAVSLVVLFVITVVFGYYKQAWHYQALLSYFDLQVPRTLNGHTFYATGLNFLRNCPIIVGFAVSIKLLKRWWLKHQETEQAAKEKAKAELLLLKAGIHPHFLFNSLNNIYSLALESSPRAPGMIRQLSGLLHYMINDCNQAQVALERELKMIQDYISLERVRYGERLALRLDILSSPVEAGGWRIAPLLFIPFVENSFKHGTSRMLSHAEISLGIHIDEGVLHFQLSNSRPPDGEGVYTNGHGGLGLKNVKKRLALLYPGRHELTIKEEPARYAVSMSIDMAGSGYAKRGAIVNKGGSMYEWV